MGSANERRRCNVTSSLVGWAHTQNRRMIFYSWYMIHALTCTQTNDALSHWKNMSGQLYLISLCQIVICFLFNPWCAHVCIHWSAFCVYITSINIHYADDARKLFCSWLRYVVLRHPHNACFYKLYASFLSQTRERISPPPPPPPPTVSLTLYSLSCFFLSI